MPHLEPEQQGNFQKIPLLYRLIATGLGAGYSPVASGTAGSMMGILLYLPFAFINHLVLLIVTVIVFIAGTIASNKVEKVIGDDPSIVVIDEIVGMWISLLFLPVSVWTILLSFFLFRIYDIFKPSPARESESLKNGLGIMMDDVVAGFYANMTSRVILILIAYVKSIF